MKRDKLTRRNFVATAVSSATGIAAGFGERATPAPGGQPSPQSAPGTEIERPVLDRLAAGLLPSDLDERQRAAVVDAFLQWLRGYQPDAEMDHGYGFTRERRTAPHPGLGYPDDVEALQRAAHDGYGRSLTELDDEQLRGLLVDTLEAAVNTDGRLPGRPAGTHIAVDMLTHYYRSAEANDRCYGVAIRRETCRGLFTDVESLAPLDPTAGNDG